MKVGDRVTWDALTLLGETRKMYGIIEEIRRGNTWTHATVRDLYTGKLNASMWVGIFHKVRDDYEITQQDLQDLLDLL